MEEVADQHEQHEEQADHHGGVDHHEQVGEPAWPHAPHNSIQLFLKRQSHHTQSSGKHSVHFERNLKQKKYLKKNNNQLSSNNQKYETDLYSFLEC